MSDPGVSAWGGLLSGGVCSRGKGVSVPRGRGVSDPGEGVSAPGGACSGGVCSGGVYVCGIPACTEADTPL